MTRAWLVAVLIALSIAAAKAIPIEQQIIIFGGLASSASGGSATPCGTGIIDLSTGCSLPIALGLVP